MSDAAAAAVVVLTTTADEESARALSMALVGEGLAACVTRTAVRSVYRWDEGETSTHDASAIRDDAEVLLVIKTARSRLAALQQRILELHRYSCPEVIAIAADHVEERYRTWLLAACGEPGDSVG
ncbi:MAG TPA: divalent-cation tolerance protein CutA [Candidatus Binatia bacterium]|jgi:periplasmic divalent cation tolerance protein